MGFRLKNIFNKKEKAVLFFEPGGIGDYMFCRPFFRFINQSEKFKNIKKIYVVKDYFQEFMSAYDSNYFDEIIPYNTNDFENDRHYRKYLFNKINKYNYKQIVNLRTIVVDNLKDYNPRKRIIRALKSNTKTVNAIYVKNKDRRLNQYNDIIYSDKVYDFELERKRKFFEALLDIKIDSGYTFEIESVINTTDNIAISMFATTPNRMYSLDKWKQLLNMVSQQFPNKNFVFLGANSEKKEIDNFIKNADFKDKCKNIAGMPLSVIPSVLKQCELLLSVESGNVHVAQAVGCKTICLSNGSYYQRFHPYPDNENVKYIYTDSFQSNLKNNDLDLWDTYGGNQDWNVDEISIETVLNVLTDILRGG